MDITPTDTSRRGEQDTDAPVELAGQHAEESGDPNCSQDIISTPFSYPESQGMSEEDLDDDDDDDDVSSTTTTPSPPPDEYLHGLFENPPNHVSTNCHLCSAKDCLIDTIFTVSFVLLVYHSHTLPFAFWLAEIFVYFTGWKFFRLLQYLLGVGNRG